MFKCYDSERQVFADTPCIYKEKAWSRIDSVWNEIN